MKLTTLAACVAACALLSAPAFAQSPPQTTGIPPAHETLSAADFVNNVVMRGMFDVQAARLAEQKGDQSDKIFAQREVSNDTKMTSDIKSMASSEKINASIPTSLTSEYQQRIARLQKLSGKQFDEVYANDQLRDHENLTALLDRYAKNGDNTALKQWASKTLPEVKQQLSEAAKLG